MIDPLSHLPGYALRRASTSALAELGRRLAATGLRHTDVSVLMLVGANPGITQSDLGRFLDIQRANMAPLIGRLDDMGLLVREAVDGRSQGLRLSDKGAMVAHQGERIVQAFEDELIARVPENARDGLIEALNAIWQR
jgi:DNA-binding MarR family transcriptional regulator